MNFNKVKHWFYLQKEGIIVGGILGAFLYSRGWNLPVNLPDVLSSGIPKLAIFILIFGGIGAAIDAVYKPNK